MKELCDYEEEAHTITTDHDKGWSLRDARDEMEVIAEMLTKSWWQSVPSKDFHEEIARVLPTFDCELVRGAKRLPSPRSQKMPPELKSILVLTFC